MKIIVYNIRHFFKEAKTIFKVDFGSNIFSIFSIGFILFILSMIFSGWFIIKDMVDVLQSEAEVNVYYEEGLKSQDIDRIQKRIKAIDGVNEINLIGESESYERMVDILGEEAEILNLFDDNPFTSFIEVKIDIEKSDTILEGIGKIDDINYIRDNKDIIDKLKSIITILTVLGILVVGAVSVSTIFVISHIIRQGIYNNREQIRTLKLLGAPDSFIDIPFVLEGLFLTLGGGLVASFLISLILYFGYGQIGKSMLFIPIPSSTEIIPYMVIGIMIISMVLGILGSLFGLKSTKTTN